MTKPNLPTPNVGRLEAVTAAASSQITKLQKEVEWYRAALQQKSTWARELELERDVAIQRLYLALYIGVPIAIAGATSLALRWL